MINALRPYIAFLPFCAGVFLAADDQTVIVTVLPEVMLDLEVAVSELDRASWIITGYLIGYTAAVPLMGRVSDRFGHREVFLVVLAVFMVGSALVALSPAIASAAGQSDRALEWMVGARVFQAIGGGAIIPIAIASAGHLVPDNRHAIAYGLVGASAEAGVVIGPLWGGAITHALSWEWAFWLNLPGAVLVGALVMLTPSAPRHRVKVDVLGGLLFAAALSLFTLGLASMARPWTQYTWYFAAAAGTTLMAAWRHARAAEPLVPRSLFRGLGSLGFQSANVAHLLVGGALIIGMVTVPLMANTVLESSALEGGLRLLRMTVAIALAALVGGVITQRYGGRLPALAGVALVAAGYLGMSRWDEFVADPWMTVHLALAGAGFGLLIAPITESALRRTRREDRGAGAALVTVSRLVGMTIGLAALTAWGTSRFLGLTEQLPVPTLDPVAQAAFSEGAVRAGVMVFRGFFMAGAALAVAMIVPVFLMTRRDRDMRA